MNTRQDFAKNYTKNAFFRYFKNRSFPLCSTMSPSLFQIFGNHADRLLGKKINKEEKNRDFKIAVLL